MPPRRRTIKERVDDLSLAMATSGRIISNPCGRCIELRQDCLVDSRSGRCQGCVNAHVSCDLRMTFREFKKLAEAREKLDKQVMDAEDELCIFEGQARKSRDKVRRLRNQLRAVENKELSRYAREMADIAIDEEVERRSSLKPCVDKSIEEVARCSEFPDDLSAFDNIAMVQSHWEQLISPVWFPQAADGSH